MVAEALDNAKVSIDTARPVWCGEAEPYTTVALQMAGPPPHRATSRNDDDAIEAVLEAARKALARGDGWICDDAQYNRLRRDCERVGISDSSYAITLALRDAIQEITRADMRKRLDPSYSGLQPDQTLYECVWNSHRFTRRMYFKFAMIEADVEVITFHEDAPKVHK